MTKKVQFFLIVGFMVSFNAAYAQLTVRGKVTSAEEKTPIPGVNIILKGTSIGTITDIEGQYSLSVPSGESVLVFSFIGLLPQEINVQGRTAIDVQMQSDVRQLGEVVVTAVGIERSERSLGYSASKVDNAEIVKARSPNVLNSLQGKIAGVNITSSSGNPGASSRIILRGFSSLSGSNQPLFVVDGVPVNNDVVNSNSLNGGLDFGNRANDINPEDIESVTVLKGASGTALYGSRAANGVIIITTKKGKSALQSKGPEITVASSATFDTPLRLPKFQNEYGQGFFNAPDLIENTSWGPKFDGQPRLWGRVINDSQQLKSYAAQKSNIKDFFDIGKTYNNSIAIADANGLSSYYLSYSNVYSDGIFPTKADFYNRNTISLRGSTVYREKLSASASINYVNKKNKFVPTGQDQSVYDNIMQTPRDMSLVDHKDYNSEFTDLNGYFSGFTQNPYYVLNEHGNKAVENRVFGNVSLEYSFSNSLKATGRIGGDVSNTELKDWRAVTDVWHIYSDEVGRVRLYNYFTSEFNSDLMVTYSKDLSENFRLTALIGNNINARSKRESSAAVIGLDIPDFYDLSNSSATPVINEDTRQKRIIGAYSSVDLAFRDFLFLTLQARNDWSSTLPKENNSFFYPGANLSFIFSDALRLPEPFSYGKFRTGWARTGNDADPYLTRSIFEKAQQYDGYRYLRYPLAGNISGSTVGDRIGNNQLRPEMSTEFEIGGELKFYNNRLGIDFSYYDRSITDLIWDVDLAFSTGYALKTFNLGKITNKGIELMVNVVPVQTKSFTWNMSFNYTKNSNKLVELVEGLDQVDIDNVSIAGGSDIRFIGIPGKPLGVFKARVARRDPQGRVVVDNTGTPIPETTLEEMGNSQYDFMAGVTNNFSFKGLSLGFTFDIRQGGIMYSRTADIMYFAGIAEGTLYNDRQPFIIPNSVQESGERDENGNPIYTENTTPIDRLHYYSFMGDGGVDLEKTFLINKSFVKLRELSLSYTLPASIIDKTAFKDIQISLIGRNLFLWTPSENKFIDPEVTTFGNDLRADFGEYSASPTVKSYGVNLRVTF